MIHSTTIDGNDNKWHQSCNVIIMHSSDEPETSKTLKVDNNIRTGIENASIFGSFSNLPHG